MKNWQVYGHEHVPILFHQYASLKSTNTEAVRMAQVGAPEWTVIVADEQTQGKGRYERRWLSPKGLGMYFSIVLKPAIDLQLLNLINLRSVLVVREFLQNKINSTGNHQRSEFLVKWPNDVLANGKKICGILLESEIVDQKIQFLVVGIGININHQNRDFPEVLRDTAISMRMLTDQSWEIEQLMQELLPLYQMRYRMDQETDHQNVVSEYEEYMAFKGESIEIDLQTKKLKGRIKGIDPFGFLLLQQGNKVQRVTSGDLWI